MSDVDPSSDSSLDVLLASLDAADVALRAVYRALAENPDLADAEVQVGALRTERDQLARQVGIAMLGRHRAARAQTAPTEPTAPAAPVVIAPPVGDAEAPDDAISDAVAASEPPTDRISAADLARWKSAVRESGFGVRLAASRSESTPWSFVLHELMETVGAPRRLDEAVNVIDETDALDAVSADDRREGWTRLPRRVQQVWLSMLVARTRALNELPAGTPETRRRAKAIISRFPPWAKEHVPGHVNGLQIKHEPLQTSWSTDATHYWRELMDLHGVELIARSPVTPKKRTKPDAAEDAIEAEPIFDPAWPPLARVRGCAAIMIGGEPREPNRARIQRLLQLGSLEWPSIDGPRKVEAVSERVRHGTYGLVLVLKNLVAHKEAVPIIEAARSAGTAWALADGYGTTAVRAALDRFLAGEHARAGGP